MKSFKLAAINALTLIIGLGLMSGSFSSKSAKAAKLEAVPSIEVTQLGNYKGQYLTVLYAVGSRPFISTDASQLNISQVKESRTVYITGDTVTLPQVQVEKEGFRPSYNIVVFVVSPQQNYSWVNADGTSPQGMPKTANQLRNKINAINKSDVDSFITSKGDKAVLPVKLN
ncbi:hypothetical protein ACLVWU_12390 [Bdellovibrio sp. HCB290]|uniref:hypothetical protein n=1 Tax=Bdellovibrio sp. HCB290 TaxID=3394356 RepID=UPI0039B6E15C